MMDITMDTDCKLFIAIVEANPMIEIYHPDINSLIRDVLDQTGRRLFIKPGLDHYDHPYQTDYDGDPREMYRKNSRKFHVYL